MRLSFNSDGKGTYTDENRIIHQTEWKFNSKDFQDIELKVGPPYSVTYQWSLVEITDKALYNTTFVGDNIMVTARCIPVH
ncbi:MAG: hypothetical protein LH619_09860 [Chitinophagaceae bacterium]|nr:hypothetical protein [Chitinophagaceae bacterium]